MATSTLARCEADFPASDELGVIGLRPTSGRHGGLSPPSLARPLLPFLARGAKHGPWSAADSLAACEPVIAESRAQRAWHNLLSVEAAR